MRTIRLMELHCIRHGATASNVRGALNGRNHEGLTEDQVARLRYAVFDSSGYDAIFCSPLNRAVETARCLSIPEYIKDSRIVERDFGAFEGLTLAECEALYPAEFAVFRSLEEHHVVPGGESRAQQLERVVDWLEEISGMNRVLAITHGGIIDFLYRMGTGRPLHGGTNVYSGQNGSMNKFEIDWPSVRMVEYSVELGRQARHPPE